MNNGTTRPLEFNTPHNSLRDEFCKRTLELATVTTAWLPNALTVGLFGGLRFPRYSAARWLAVPSNPFNTEVIGRCQCADCVTQTTAPPSPTPMNLGLVACVSSGISDGIMAPLAMYSREFQARLPVSRDKHKTEVALATTTLHLALAIVSRLCHHGDPAEHPGTSEVLRHELIEAWIHAAPGIVQPMLRETQLCAAGFVAEISTVEIETGEVDVAYCQSLSSMFRYAAAQWVGPPIVRNAHSKLLEPFARMRLGHLRQQATESAPLPLCAMMHDILAAAAMVAFVELESDTVCFGRGNTLCYDQAHGWFESLIEDLEAASYPFSEPVLSPPWPYGSEHSTDMTLVPSVPDVAPPLGPAVSWTLTGDHGGGRITVTTTTTTASVPVLQRRKRARDAEDATCPTPFEGASHVAKRQRLAHCPH